MSTTDALCAWLFDGTAPPPLGQPADFREAVALLDELPALGLTDPAARDALAGLIEEVLWALPPTTRSAWARDAMTGGPQATLVLTPFALVRTSEITDRICAWLFDGGPAPTGGELVAAPSEALACLDELADLIAALVPEPGQAVLAEASLLEPLEDLLAAHLPEGVVAAGPRGAMLMAERITFAAPAPITQTHSQVAPLPTLPEVTRPLPTPAAPARRWPVVALVAIAAAILFFVLRPGPIEPTDDTPPIGVDPESLVTAPPVVAPPSASDAYRKAKPIPATDNRPRMMPIPAGTFTMGSHPDEVGHGEWEAQRQVTLTRAFYMARTEITQAQWAAVLGEYPSRFGQRPRNPVEQINWFDAIRYVNALSKLEGYAPCYRITGTRVDFEGLDCLGYRLPTEAEWEYAARAGTTTATYAGDLDLIDVRNAPVLSDIAWYSGNAGLPDGPLKCPEPEKMQFPAKACGTHPVATRRGNAFGLHDMIGNVWEWTHDNWGPPVTEPTIDPLGADDDARRVTKGCGWFRDARFCRAANRYRPKPGYVSSVVGMRPVRTIR